MKVALVHDYLREYGGAERVLRVLADMYPEAPIYTAFCTPDSSGCEAFADREIITSFGQRIPGFDTRLYSPLRFLAPYIWESFDFSDYEVVISSASWYITKGIVTRPETLHVCYCHTPPRYLYGLPTSVNYQKYWLVRQYARVINRRLKTYDQAAAARVDVMVTNSKNTQQRIRDAYDMEAQVIYPPVDVQKLETSNKKLEKHDYFLTGGRLTGGKNFDLAVQACVEANVPLKVFGEGRLRGELENMSKGKVEFVGKVSDDELGKLYAGAKAFIALAEDEDFGITPVEAMAMGTPVLAYRGGGYVETVTEGKTGIFVDSLDLKVIGEGMRQILQANFQMSEIRAQAERFGRERFEAEMGSLVETTYRVWQEDYA